MQLNVIIPLVANCSFIDKIISCAIYVQAHLVLLSRVMFGRIAITHPHSRVALISLKRLHSQLELLLETLQLQILSFSITFQILAGLKGVYFDKMMELLNIRIQEIKLEPL